MQKMKEGNPVGVLLLNEIQATVGEQHRDENPHVVSPCVEGTSV